MTTLLSLFLGAFLAATILPFSSELMLVAALKAGEISAGLLVFVATLGNVLGALVNWALGAYMLHWVGKNTFPSARSRSTRLHYASTNMASGRCCLHGYQSSATP